MNVCKFCGVDQEDILLHETRCDKRPAPLTSNVRTGRLFKDGGYTAEKDWVPAEDYACQGAVIRDLTAAVERLRALLRDSRISIDKAADADCVCVDGPQRCKYCRPHRALRDRIDAALSGDSSQVETSDCPECKAKWELWHDQYCKSNKGRPNEHGGGLAQETSAPRCTCTGPGPQRDPECAVHKVAMGKGWSVPDETLDRSKPNLPENGSAKS